MVPSALSDLSARASGRVGKNSARGRSPSALFLATRPEASADKSDNARRNHTLIVLLCFLLRSMRMRESHVFVSRWLKVALILQAPSISIITTKEDGVGSQFSICSRF